MVVEERLKSKSLYKILVVAIKYTPLCIALCYILNTVLACFNIYFDPLSNIAGMSLITWLFTYIATIVFQFCIYHRMFLWYIFADDVLNIIDYYWKLPLSTSHVLMLHNSIIGLLLLVYVKNHKRKVASNNSRY
jgi:hypothetical protein